MKRILAPVGLGRRARVVTFQGTPRSSALPARAAQIQGRSVARTARQRHEPSGRPERSGARCRVSRWDGLTDRVGSIGWRVTTSNGCSGFGTGGVVSRGLQPNLTVVGSETRRPNPLDRRPHSQSSKAAHLTSFDQVILRHRRCRCCPQWPLGVHGKRAAPPQTRWGRNGSLRPPAILQMLPGPGCRPRPCRGPVR